MPDSPTQTSQPPTVANSNPRLSGGCIQILIVGGFFVLLIAWFVWHLSSQLKEMRGFMETTPAELSPLVPSALEREQLLGRLQVFAQSMDEGKEAELNLSVTDLNHLLASQEPVSRMKDYVKVEEISEMVRLKVSLAINGMPFSGERLYFNGFFMARPEMSGEGKDRRLVIHTRSIEVPGRTLSQGFTQKYQEANHLDTLLMEEVRKDPKVMAWLSKISAVRCEPGKVVVEYRPQAAAPVSR